eukprot:NODE_6071_length_1708_cov_11.425680.p1 GENE.NODE_6071_length_1708_cov_11.425680~~NODE_6071_length_1708_cov_11.425680.p1  ORF type:complete len:409 (+),score=96.50 NODE_6071_length_1708_cov_11.425680:222-1448(+)
MAHKPATLRQKAGGTAALIGIGWHMIMGFTFGVAPAWALLFLPTAAMRALSVQWMRFVKASYTSHCWFLLRICTGMKLVLHTQGPVGWPEAALRPGRFGDYLILSNHKTSLDWMLLWGAFTEMQRISGVVIAMKDMRKVPFAGPAVMAFGFPLLSRTNKEQDVQALRRGAELGTNKHPAAYLIFPEGRDLLPRTQKENQAYAREKGLPVYNHVMHPKVVGTMNIWDALTAVAAKSSRPPPVVLDLTMGFHEFQPNERLTEGNLFLKGRAVKEVHVYIDIVESPKLGSDAEAKEFCSAIFAAKEARLARFYAPCLEGKTATPDVTAFQNGEVTTQTLGITTGLGGFAFHIVLDFAFALITYRLGVVGALLLLALSASASLAISRGGSIADRIERHAERWPSHVSEKKSD